VENTTTKTDSPLAKHAPVENTTTKTDSPLAKPVPVENTTTKSDNPLAKHAQAILTALLGQQVVSIMKRFILSIIIQRLTRVESI
jgi:hypothetical protein